MYNTHPKRKLLADMDKTMLLKMREEGMTNQEIADAVGCSKMTIYRTLGPMTTEQRSVRNRQNAYNRTAKISEGGYTVERKMQSFMPQREEPAKAVLVMKTLPPAPIPLHGEFADYTISADRQTIEVENEKGRVLILVPAEKLGTFITELQAIEKNIAAENLMQFWG